MTKFEHASLHLQLARCLWEDGQADRALLELNTVGELCTGSELEVQAEMLRAEIHMQRGNELEAPSVAGEWRNTPALSP